MNEREYLLVAASENIKLADHALRMAFFSVDDADLTVLQLQILRQLLPLLTAASTRVSNLDMKEGNTQ